MPVLAAIFWGLNALLDLVGHLSFKAAAVTDEDGLTRRYWTRLARRPWLWLGVACFAVEFLVWLAFLSLVPLAEGVLLGTVNVVLLMFAGRLVFHEKLTGWRIAGMLLVSAGVVLVGLG